MEYRNTLLFLWATGISIPVLFLFFIDVNAEEINKNSLMYCVEDITKAYQNVANNTTNIPPEPLRDPHFLGMVIVKACMLSYEHNGEYLNQIPQDQYSKYLSLAAMAVYLK